MKLVRIAYSLLKLAALPMKVLSADRRGVIIGLGQPISIPSLAQGVEGGEIKTTENYPKKLHWDPEKNIWTYIYLSKGLPLRGDTIGLGERGMVAYYKVTKSTPTLIQLDLVKDQKMPKGSAESMFKSTLKFDAETIREIRTPYYYKQIVLKSEKTRGNYKQYLR